MQKTRVISMKKSNEQFIEETKLKFLRKYQIRPLQRIQEEVQAGQRPLSF